MSSAVTLTPEQYDIVWEDLKLGEQPYPITVRSHGRTMQERARIRNQVYGELTVRHLAEGPRIGPEITDALVTMSVAPVSVDMIWLPERSATSMCNALAVAAGEQGLLARLADDGLRLMPMRGSAVIRAMLDLLPEMPAAPGRSITVPTEDLTRAGKEQSEEGSIYQASRSSTSTVGQQIRSLETLFAKPRIRGGQIVANVLDRHGRRSRSRPLEWFDTEDGRCMAQTGAGSDGREHLLVAPADNARIAGRVRDMLEALAGTK